jgi:membrane protease YdiL (CAAX protease family)
MKSLISKHQLLSFFVLTYALAYSAGFGFTLLNPGKPLLAWSFAWIIFIFSPTISSLLISWIIGGMVEVKRLLAGFTRWKVSIVWYIAAGFLILGPLMIAGVRILAGYPAEGIQPGTSLALILVTMLTQLFAGPASEEAGWRGFALPRLQARFSALVSSLILGVVWTCWHLPLFFISGQAQVSIPFPIYLLLVSTVGVYLTWLYNNTRGSLIITILAHYCYNLTGVFVTGMIGLMPAMTFYMTAGPLLFLVVVGVVIVFGPKYLSKKPVAELPHNQPVGSLPSAR